MQPATRLSVLLAVIAWALLLAGALWGAPVEALVFASLAAVGGTGNAAVAVRRDRCRGGT